MKRLLLRVSVVAGLSMAAAAQAASVVAFSPQGEVAQVRQLVVKFSEAVVAFGDPRLPDPLEVACQGAAPAGTGRWSSDRSWLYDFRAPLPPGTRCTVKPKPGWAPSTGALTGRTEFAFSTGGPAIVLMQPGNGGNIEEDQHFLIRLNGPAVESSVVANAWCEVEGIGERLPLRIVGGAVRDEVLKSRHIEKEPAARTLVARCDRPLPNNAAVRVVWGKGIAAVANPQVVTSVEQRFRYQVRAAFTAEFTCEREKATAPCLPIRPMTVRFSAPVPRALITQVRLVPVTGAPVEPVFDKDDKAAELGEVTFPTPLAENASYSVVMPVGLQDNAGRPLSNASSFPLKVGTGGAPPIAKFAAAPFGIVERNADTMLPVTLRHVQPDLRGGGPVPAASAASPASAKPAARSETRCS